MTVQHIGSDRSLAARELLWVEGRIGVQVHCDAGALWLTQDGLREDVVLQAGQSFRLAHDIPALVYALEDARLSVARPCPEAAPRLTRERPATRRSWLRGPLPA